MTEPLESAVVAPLRSDDSIIRTDYALIGMGLQNILLTLALLREQPGVRIVAFERGRSVGGNHTWSFQESDVPAPLLELLEPIIERRWPAYDVAFPGYERRIESSYATISSDRVAEYFSTLGDRVDLHLNTAVDHIADGEGTLADETRVQFAQLSDARGPDANPGIGPCGYQKFLGIEYELSKSAPRDVPMIMDARVPQTDGYRFIYVLPITATRVLIEDTYFSDGTELDIPLLRRGIEAYAREHGYAIGETLREESGVLPLPYGKSDVAGERPDVTGYAGGWFHPATGYSLPSAIRVAQRMASGARGGADWHRFVRHHRSQAAFCRLLNRLLFCGYEPELRRNVFERFYQLNEETIARFYAMEMTWADRLRILFGGPPRGFSLARYVRNARK